MINPEDEIIIDLSTSCTKEVAVAKLLGWMQGPIRPKVLKVSEHGISEDQLPFLQFMEGSLQAQLSELREAASQDLIAAAEADATSEVLKEKEEAVANIDSLIHKAFMYMSDIEEELEKDSESAINIDQKTSKQTGVTHITLRSVNRWAKDKYGISILEDREQHASPEGTQAQPIMQDTEEDLDTEGGLSKTRAGHLFTTFALLFEDLAKHLSETAPKKYGDRIPNIEAIAMYIEKLAKKANNRENLPGQGHEAIKDRIEEAMEIKKSKLPQK